MHLTLSVRRGLTIVAGTLFSFAVVTPVLAELSVDLRCSELQVGTYPDASRCNTASIPPTSPTPGEIYSTALSGSDGGNAFSAAATGRADYGTLGVSAFAAATNTTVAVSSSADTRTMQTLASARSGWIDTYTVGGVSGLVAIQVDMVVDISAFSQAQSDGMLSTAYLTFSTSNYGPGWCLGMGTTACSGASTLQEGTNNLSFIAYLDAGSTGVWQSSLYAEAQVYSEGIGSGEVNINALNTVHSYFTVLTDGASMEWSSGNDYSVPSPIPEPEIYALMGAGLGLMGWAARRRKQQVA